jgi:peptide/nickel transport system substrate-binding protein
MQQITDATGSGPFRFLRDQWQAGVQAVYARNPDYVPRNEPPSWTAGGKVAHLERVEWRIIRDATTAGAALQSGEVDWYDEVHPDLVPALRRNRNVRVAVRSRLGNFLIMRFNQLHPPFDKVAVRRAVMLAVDQSEYGVAAMGNDPALAKECYSFFTCDTPMASEVGSEPLHVRSIDRAKAALASSGYNGERVILLSATEIPNVSASAQLTLQTLQRMGMNAEIVATDFATIIQRRANRDPGAWNIFFTGWSGADVMNPAVNASLRGNGVNAWPGWPTEPRLEALRAQWLVAADEAEQRRIAQEMQRVAFETVPYVPLSRIFLPSGFRANVEGVISAPPALFWNVRKT